MQLLVLLTYSGTDFIPTRKTPLLLTLSFFHSRRGCVTLILGTTLLLPRQGRGRGHRAGGAGGAPGPAIDAFSRGARRGRCGGTGAGSRCCTHVPVRPRGRPGRWEPVGAAEGRKGRASRHCPQQGHGRTPARSAPPRAAPALRRPRPGGHREGGRRPAGAERGRDAGRGAAGAERGRPPPAPLRARRRCR